jgi:site-specific recombinase XerD
MPDDAPPSRWAWYWFNDPAAVSDDEGLPEWSAGECERARSALRLKAKPYPVFIGPDGEPDPDLLAWATSPAKAGLGSAALQTKETYAKGICVWLNFLHVACGGKEWREATRDDVLNFDYWRSREVENSGRVGGDANSRGLAALVRLYRWAADTDVGLVEVDPVYRLVTWNGRSTPETQPKNDRAKDVKWLTRLAFEKWKQVGFEGYDAKGNRLAGTRVRTRARSVAFCDLVYATGLRLTEAGGLLACELPTAEVGQRILTGELAAGLAKYRKRRKFYMRANRMRTVEDYVELEREAYIYKANQRGTYHRIPNRLTVTHASGSGWDTVLTIRPPVGDPYRRNLSDLEAAERMRLYEETPERVLDPATGEQVKALRPMWLWLAESGLPMEIASWDEVFDQASERCRAAGLDYWVHPHMLRHSFALHMLVQAQRAFLLPGLSREQQERYQRLFGNPWHLVKDLLGHSDVKTTMDHYLQPLTGLQLEYVLTAEDDRTEGVGLSVVDEGDERSRVQDVDEVLSRVAQESGRVQDAPQGEGAE